MLTGSNTLTDKLDSFSEGVVDYITKPFSAQEVAARLRVHLRRWGANGTSHQADNATATAHVHTSPNPRGLRGLPGKVIRLTDLAKNTGLPQGHR